MLSSVEENYLKYIFQLSEYSVNGVVKTKSRQPVLFMYTVPWKTVVHPVLSQALLVVPEVCFRRMVRLVNVTAG